MSRYTVMRVSKSGLVFALLLFLLPACVSLNLNREVTFYSLPPGAEVLVDGESTDRYTPCLIDMGLFTGDCLVTFKKPGFKTEKRDLNRLFSLGMSRPSQAVGEIESEILLVPFFWTAEDVLLPIKFESGNYPHNIFVRLFKEDEKPE